MVFKLIFGFIFNYYANIFLTKHSYREFTRTTQLKTKRCYYDNYKKL